MTNEEAIVQLEIDATNLVGRLASEPVHDTSFSELWTRKLEAIDIAIYAIKMLDKHEAECERCACNLLAERDAIKEEKLISADVAEVVHCCQCKHDGECAIKLMIVSENGNNPYCSLGKRRGEDNV